jgi:putative hydrolase of the HAD superfamily
MRHFKIIIFDLDDTLFDTWGLLVQTALEEACQKMIQAGLQAELKEAVDFRKELYKNNPRCNFWKEIVTRFGVRAGVDPAEVAEAGDIAFHKRNVVEPIHLFPKAEEMLQRLQQSYKTYLVTAGNHETQNQKIKQLYIQELFQSIYCVDPMKGETKKMAFEKILKMTGVHPNECISVGNRMDQEIKMAKELGMQTCYVLHGEYIHMKPSCDAEKPDFTVETVCELEHILEMDQNLLKEAKQA